MGPRSVNGFGGPVVLDMSAWARVALGCLDQPDTERYEHAVRGGEVMICEPFRLEALYSARDLDQYEGLKRQLDALPSISSGPKSLDLALRGQLALARERSVSHRVKPLDLVISAIAHEHGVGVLHYDHDYDVIAKFAGLRVRSVWIAARGSVN